SYSAFVEAMRAQLPGNVDFIVGRVTDLRTSAARQKVMLLEGATITARLVVLATGMGDVLRRSLGIERQTIHPRQSLSFGFNLVPEIGRASCRDRQYDWGIWRSTRRNER